jgi:hypothetical protein
MAETPKEEDDEDEWTAISDEEEEIFDDYALRGFRFLFNNLDGIEHDAIDIQEEEDDEEAEVEVVNEEVKPTPAFIAQKLIDQGVTMEQLIKGLLIDHQEYESHEDEFDRINDEIFGKMRIIISNYTPEQAIPAPAPTPVAPVTEIDSSAQPKVPSIMGSRRIMMHV